MILLMGLIGTGKSTQGHILAKRLNCPWISPGELIRSGTTPQQRQQMLAGELINDEQICNLVENKFNEINASKNEFILDGFPRTVGQTKWLIDKIQSGELHLTSVIYLQAPEDEMKKRLLARGRVDDSESVIDERFKKFNQATMPVLDYLRSQDIEIKEIDATPSVDEIAANIAKALELS